MKPDLRKLLAGGESRTLEFKKSTAELREALQTVCAFANGKGGRVVIGVKPDGTVIGQQVSDQTLHEIAAARDRFEPLLGLEIQTVEVASGRSAGAPPTFSTGWEFAGRDGCSARRSCSSARPSCPTTPSASYAWPGSGESTRRSSSTSGSGWTAP